jgi:hypothetical protein
MGGNAPSKQEFKYSVPVSEPVQGETAVYRAPGYEEALLTTVGNNGWTTAQQLY